MWKIKKKSYPKKIFWIRLVVADFFCHPKRPESARKEEPRKRNMHTVKKVLCHSGKIGENGRQHFPRKDCLKNYL